MKKEKKITVRFYLNKQLEPVTGEKKKKYYPLYLYITYDRRNMQFRSKYGLYYDSLKEVEPGLMDFEENSIRKIIAYESSFTSEPYELKGLRQRYDVYAVSIQQAVEDYIKPKLRLAILKTNDELTAVLDFNQPQATSGRLYAVAKKLFTRFEKSIPATLNELLDAYETISNISSNPPQNGYNFPTVIDWVAGDFPQELGAALTRLKMPPAKQQAATALIEQAVAEKLKLLKE